MTLSIREQKERVNWSSEDDAAVDELVSSGFSRSEATREVLETLRMDMRAQAEYERSLKRSGVRSGERK